MGKDERLLRELLGAITDMAAVVDVLAENMPGEEFRRISDRVVGLASHIRAARSLIDIARTQEGASHD